MIEKLVKHWISKVTGEDWYILNYGKKHLVLSPSLGNIISMAS